MKKAVATVSRIELVTPFQRVRTRNDLPLLLNALGCKGEGVEIGVQTGYYSHILLKRSQLSKVHSVDPWKSFASKDYVDIANMPARVQQVIYHFAKWLLSFHGSRSQIVRRTSAEAAPMFADNSLDFIYIDANHAYEAVREDLHLWWPKLRKGGIFAGHDFFDGHVSTGLFGVKKAVEEFAQTRHLAIHVTKDMWPTWYTQKPF